MQYEFKESDRPHIYVFDRGWEINALRAAFSEAVAKRMLKGNVNSVTEWESYLASVPEDENSITQALPKPQAITDVLEEYYINTEDEMFTISQESSLPAFKRGKQIGQRLLTGNQANDLLKIMLEACAKNEMANGMATHELSVEEQVQEFRRTTLDGIPEVDD